MRQHDKSGVPIAQNPYEQIYIDLTTRCNMKCNFCYNPAHMPKDLPLESFRRICAELPRPVNIKLLGGEPALHPDVIEIMRTAHAHGHTVYLGSNGSRYADIGFMEKLSKLKHSGVPFTLGMSMDGGHSNAAAYEAITGVDCIASKLEALDALVRSRLARLCLTAIIVRGLNEDVIAQLLELARRHPKAIRYIHFRNASMVGRWAETQQYGIEELKGLVREHFSDEQFRPRCVGELSCPADSGNECCYRFRPDAKLQISLIEFATARSALCPKRGRIMVGSDNIHSFFGSMRQKAD